MKFYGWFVLHFIGLIMMIVTWSPGGPPTILVPGIFGFIGGAVYAAGTMKMVQEARR